MSSRGEFFALICGKCVGRWCAREGQQRARLDSIMFAVRFTVFSAESACRQCVYGGGRQVAGVCGSGWIKGIKERAP